MAPTIDNEKHFFQYLNIWLSSFGQDTGTVCNRSSFYLQFPYLRLIYSKTQWNKWRKLGRAIGGEKDLLHIIAQLYNGISFSNLDFSYIDIVSFVDDNWVKYNFILVYSGSI